MDRVLKLLTSEFSMFIIIGPPAALDSPKGFGTLQETAALTSPLLCREDIFKHK